MVLARYILRVAGEIPSATLRQRIADASAAELDRWLERVLTSASPDDVFEP